MFGGLGRTKNAALSVCFFDLPPGLLATNELLMLNFLLANMVCTVLPFFWKELGFGTAVRLVSENAVGSTAFIVRL